MHTKLDIYVFIKVSNEIVQLYICYEFHICFSKSMSLKRKHNISSRDIEISARCIHK
jgi:hypothetical protein